MLPAKYKLDAREIPFLAKKGKRFEGKYLIIKAWYTSEQKHPKFAISISKKIDNRAVYRNKIRRQLRSAIRELNIEDFFRPGKYLIIVKSSDLIDKKIDKKQVIKNTFQTS